MHRENGPVLYCVPFHENNNNNFNFQTFRYNLWCDQFSYDSSKSGMCSTLAHKTVNETEEPLIRAAEGVVYSMENVAHWSFSIQHFLRVAVYVRTTGDGLFFITISTKLHFRNAKKLDSFISLRVIIMIKV